jgi:hypothetical protein
MDPDHAAEDKIQEAHIYRVAGGICNQYGRSCEHRFAKRLRESILARTSKSRQSQQGIRMKILVALVVTVLATSTLANDDLLYYFPAPKPSQENLTGLFPPFIAIPAPNASAINSMGVGLESALSSFLMALLSASLGRGLPGFNDSSSSGWNGTGPPFPFPTSNSS